MFQEMKNFKKDQAGVTMIEQIIAVALLGLCIVVWFNVTKVQTKGVLVSKNNLRSQNLALSKLEDLRSLALNSGIEGQFQWVTQSPLVIQYGRTNTASIEGRTFTWSVSTTFVLGYSSVTVTPTPPQTTNAIVTTTATDLIWFNALVQWSDVTGPKLLTQAAYVANPRK